MGGLILTTRESIDLRFIKLIYSPKRPEVQPSLGKDQPSSPPGGLSPGRCDTSMLRCSQKLRVALSYA